MPRVEAKHVLSCRRWCVVPSVVVLEVVVLGLVVAGIVHAIEGGREVLFKLGVLGKIDWAMVHCGQPSLSPFLLMISRLEAKRVSYYRQWCVFSSVVVFGLVVTRIVHAIEGGLEVHFKLDLIRDGFECRPGAFGCKVAEVDGQLAGYALYHRTYSTCTGHGLMLEDLYVRERMRRQGIGGRLFNAVAKEALEQGCARLELHVLDWNPARSFYEAHGAVDMTAAHWRYYRLGTEELCQAAQRE